MGDNMKTKVLGRIKKVASREVVEQVNSKCFLFAYSEKIPENILKKAEKSAK
ncbi:MULTISPECIES: AgrD family cyclic lactone autoinducer peptide [Listeria]|uniref:AgrD family cyclic lactone autoinducer peptide n=1 Tax=Listeria TaxID=1637 RepID=UPI000E7529D0|nr:MULTISPECIES: cyclic lactone autoinducer peptide [Listeria]EDH3594667.1 cyclic lactone autoinducer peptide [Listeria monocytogenes]MBC1910974.1 cyclic lactone autoinducer peptide [Listeria innocua]MBC1926108.1 cyclic lactone autoinducer peptide [Listeria innocua]MBC1929056.1 cyclic lactone autoinducer peptide [Listeria innocua]RJZ11678.1 hypothetical protein DYZ47_02942 [Listeria monocytogenes]